MNTPTFRDVERLSAYLDGQLSQADRTRLEKRLQADPELAAVLDDLRQARSLLRQTPQRRAPRNFTLTPKMAGIRPPVPRAVPALSWASAIATLLFVFTLGTNLVGRLSFGAAAPMMASAPSGNGGGQTEDTQTENGIGGGPADTQPPADATALATPSAEAFTLTAPEAPVPGTTREVGTSTAKAQPAPINLWLFAWLGLAVLLIGAALLIRWLNQQTFKKRLSKK